MQGFYFRCGDRTLNFEYQHTIYIHIYIWTIFSIYMYVIVYTILDRSIRERCMKQATYKRDPLNLAIYYIPKSTIGRLWAFGTLTCRSWLKNTIHWRFLIRTCGASLGNIYNLTSKSQSRYTSFKIYKYEHKSQNEVIVTFDHLTITLSISLFTLYLILI